MNSSYILPEPCNTRKDAIEEFAAKFAKDLGYEPGDDLAALAKDLGGKITLRSFWKDTEEGSMSLLVHAKGDFDIFLPEHTTVDRDRFSIARELGHYILHFPMKYLPIRAPRFASNRASWEATWFAAGFLTPEVEFREKFGSTPNPLHLANHFKVSVPLALARMKALSLSPRYST